jgi:hypothetical protein
MDRGRMHRRVLAPILLVVLGATALHFVVIELQPDRTAFFRGLGRTNPSYQRHPLALGEVVDVRDGHLCLPEVPFMAARVREHLWKEYGLEVTQDRVEASMRRGWPPNGRYDSDTTPLAQDAVFDAMDRVRADLRDEIVAADRRQHLLSACFVLLLSVLAMHPPPSPGTPGRWWIVSPTLTIMMVLLVPTLAPGTAPARWLLDAAEFGRRLFLGSSGPVSIALLAGLVAIGFVLWKSGQRAFRRLDLTDFPPSPMDTLRRSRTA